MTISNLFAWLLSTIFIILPIALPQFLRFLVYFFSNKTASYTRKTIVDYVIDGQLPMAFYSLSISPVVSLIFGFLKGAKPSLLNIGIIIASFISSAIALCVYVAFSISPDLTLSPSEKENAAEQGQNDLNSKGSKVQSRIHAGIWIILIAVILLSFISEVILR